MMIRKAFAKSLAVAGLGVIMAAGLVAAPVQSHHSFAMFDGSIYRVFTGVVLQVSPDANHLQIFFAPLNDERTDIVRNTDGRPAAWVVEMAAAATAAEQGITVQSFPRGTIFSVGMHPLRNGDPAGDRGAAGLFKCPVDTPPPVGAHCDAVAGSTAHGSGIIPEPGPLLEEYVPPVP